VWREQVRTTWRWLVRDSLLSDGFFFDLLEPWDVRELYYTENSGFAHATLPLHISTFRDSDFIFYPKPLYKSLHQSFFYSFITILPSESGVTMDTPLLHDFTLDPLILSFHFHFRTFVTWLRENYDYRNVSWGTESWSFQGLPPSVSCQCRF
jgi:hypothetical protein